MPALAADQVIATLTARLEALPALAGRVRNEPEDPAAEPALPVCWLYTGDEPVTPAFVSPAVNEHRLDVTLRLVVGTAGDAVAARDALAASAMAALFAAPVPHGLQLDSIGREVGTRGGIRTAAFTARATATYHVDQAAPDTILTA